MHFVALGDGTLLVEEDEPDDALDAARRGGRGVDRAAVPGRGGPPRADDLGGRRLADHGRPRSPGLRGDEAELVVTREGRTLHVDGRPTFGSAPALERVGEGQGPEYVVRASRLDGDLWEVEASPPSIEPCVEPIP